MVGMRWRWKVSALLCALALVTGLTLGGAGGVHLWAQSADAPRNEAYSLMAKMIERLKWYDETQVKARYRALMRKEVRRFDDKGDVRSETLGGYEVVPVEGEQFERLVRIHGRPLSDEERGWEVEREEAFRKEVIERRETGAEPEDDGSENSIVFDEALIARYDFTLEGQETFRSRPSYRIAFRPRAGDLPVVRRIDYALNSARGTIWVDRDTYEPARAEFELIQPVRLWWGILGMINRARGSVDRRPILGDNDLWARIQFETYVDSRVLFSRTRRREFRTWHDFEVVEPQPHP